MLIIVESSAKKSIAAAFKKMNNARGGGDWKEAAKQLEDSGKIHPMVGGKVMGIELGTNFLRTKEEKAKIQAQLKKNRAEKSVKAALKNDPTTLAKMESQTKAMERDEKSAKGEGGSTARPIVTGVISAIFGAGTGAAASSAISSTISGANEMAKKAGDRDIFGATKIAGKGAIAPFVATGKGVANVTKYTAIGYDAAQQNSTDNVLQIRSQVKEQLAATQKEISGPGGLETKADPAKKALNDIKAVENLEKQAATSPTPERKVELEKQIEDTKAGSQYFQDAKAMQEQREIQQDPASSKEQKENAGKAMAQITKKDGYIESGGAGGKENALAEINTNKTSLANVSERKEKLEAMDKAMDKSAAVISVAAAPEHKEAYDKLGIVARWSGGVFATAEDKKTISTYKKAQSAQKEYPTLGKEDTGDRATAKHENFAKKYDGLVNPSKKT